MTATETIDNALREILHAVDDASVDELREVRAKLLLAGRRDHGAPEWHDEIKTGFAVAIARAIRVRGGDPDVRDLTAV